MKHVWYRPLVYLSAILFMIVYFDQVPVSFLTAIVYIYLNEPEFLFFWSIYKSDYGVFMASYGVSLEVCKQYGLEGLYDVVVLIDQFVKCQLPITEIMLRVVDEQKKCFVEIKALNGERFQVFEELLQPTQKTRDYYELLTEGIRDAIEIHNAGKAIHRRFEELKKDFPCQGHQSIDLELCKDDRGVRLPGYQIVVSIKNSDVRKKMNIGSPIKSVDDLASAMRNVSSLIQKELQNQQSIELKAEAENLDPADVLEMNLLKEKTTNLLNETTAKLTLNAKNAWDNLKIKISKNHPYGDITIDEILKKMEYVLIFKEDASSNPENWLIRVKYDNLYWDIPALTEKNRIVSEGALLKRFQQIAYFGPELLKLLLLWSERSVGVSTNFEGRNKHKECMVHLTEVAARAVKVETQDAFVKSIRIPSKMNAMSPKELCNDIHNEIALMVDKMIPSSLQKILRDIHVADFIKELEGLGGTLTWKFENTNAIVLFVEVALEENRKKCFTFLKSFSEKNEISNLEFTFSSSAEDVKSMIAILIEDVECPVVQ